jgi:hypothetical protein
VMKIMKTILCNRAGNQFMNGCIVCFLEPICLATIPNDVIIDGFRKMEDVK